MTALEQLRAGVYGRESKDKKKSISDQIKLGVAAAAELDWPVDGRIYSDGGSASRFRTKIRGDWNQVKADFEADVLDVVLVYEMSRADRDLGPWVDFVSACRTWGKLVHLVGDDKTLDPRKLIDWKTLIDGGVDAAYETEKTSQRTKRGILMFAIDGYFHGDAPYGYARRIVGERETEHGPKPVKEQYPDPEPVAPGSDTSRASLAVDIIKRVAASVPLSVIVADLNAKGIPGPNGGKWHRRTVWKMVHNVAYIGKREYQGKIYKAQWDGLVKDKTLKDAQEVLADPKRKTTRPGRQKHLLSYLVTAPCGTHMRYAPQRTGRIARYSCGIDGCTTIPAEYADECVTDVVVERLSQPDARDLLAPKEDGSALLALEELTALTGKLEQARASYKKIKGGISLDTLESIEGDLTPLIENAKKRSVPPSAPPALMELLDAAEGGQEAIRAHWDAMPMPARRQVLTIVLGTVTVTRATQRLSRFSTSVDRQAAARSRISFGAGAAGAEQPVVPQSAVA